MINFEKMFVAAGLFLLQASGCSTSGPVKVSDYSVERDVTYKTVDGKNLTGDIYRPKLPGMKPAVVVVHGGGWSSRGGRMTQVAEDLARSGYVVFNVLYRLAPESLYPKAIEDVQAAVRFIESKASVCNLIANHLIQSRLEFGAIRQALI